MVELAGYTNIESVLGMKLTMPGSNISANVVGVVENVKLGSAKEQALPILFRLGDSFDNYNYFDSFGNIVLKISTSDIPTLVAKIRTLVEQELQLSDVTISLISDDYKALHKSENQVLDMVTIFSLLAIFLTSLGTFGLASFASLRRQKEVAVRKVLGASRLSIVNLLAREFLVLITISIALAYPITYWLVGDWLSNFNERIDQALWVYLTSALIITVITWLTVASLAFKAASTRPSLILRDE
jgi:putative ABC transport system permease protein